MTGQSRRIHRVPLVLAMLTLVAACSDAEKERAKLADIQHQADQKIAQIQQDAKDKLAEAQKQVSELQEELADAGAQAKAAADEELNKAKDEADKLAAEAAKALAKARAAYKEGARAQLLTLGKDIDELKAKATKAAPKVKPQIDQAMHDIASKKDAVKKEIDDFDTATVDTLRVAKAKVEQRFAELKQAIRTAHAKLP